MIDELEAGHWRLYINRGAPAEQVFTFTVFVIGLETSLFLLPVILSPANGASGVATNPVFFWSGPGGFSSLSVNARCISDSQGGGFANLPVSATVWTNAPTLIEGTNFFRVSYTDNGFSGITFSTPEDASSNPIDNWNAFTDLRVAARAEFVVTATPPPDTVEILTPQRVGADFVFSLQTQAGRARTHTVESPTNMTTASWAAVTNFAGDGHVKLLQLPIGTHAETYYRVGSESGAGTAVPRWVRRSHPGCRAVCPAPPGEGGRDFVRDFSANCRLLAA